MDAWTAAGITADPGRVHTEGRMARGALEQAREQVAALFRVRSRQVILTSGGTEAINAAVWGATRRLPGPVVCSAVEHSAVRDASSRSGAVVPIEVDRAGTIRPGSLIEAVDRSTQRHGTPPALVHCQWANHEVGTVQPVEEVVDLCRRRGIPTHVDAVAAAGHVVVDAGMLGADLVSVSSHKLGGPTGAGALLVGPGLRFDPFVVGGDQERARRGGMENLVAAIGFGAACEALATSDRIAEEHAIASAHTERLVALATGVTGVEVYGNPGRRLPHLVCLGIEGVEAEPILVALDQAGIAVHSGSSCSSESLAPSPVLEAMGVEGERSLRISVGWSTTADDVDAFADTFPRVVASLRALRTG